MRYEQQFLTALDSMARTQAALSQQLVDMQQTLKEVLNELALAKATPAVPPRSQYHPDNVARREFERAEVPALTVEQKWAIARKEIARKKALKHQQVVEAEPVPVVQEPAPETPVDLIAARKLLVQAAQEMDVLAELMPQLSAFRSMGYSFGQLTSILNEAGFSMPQTAVEACYGELLEKKMEMCTKRFCEKFQVPELGLGDMFSELFLDSALKDARSINSGRANMGHPADG